MNKKQKIIPKFEIIPDELIINIIKYLDYNIIVDLMCCSKDLYTICKKFPELYNDKAKEIFVNVKSRMNFIECESLVKNHSKHVYENIISAIYLENHIKSNPKFKEWNIKIYKHINYQNEGYSEVEFTLFKKNDFLFKIYDYRFKWIRAYHKGKCYGIYLQIGNGIIDSFKNELSEFIISQLNDNIINNTLENTKIYNIVKMNKRTTIDNMNDILNIMKIKFQITYDDLYDFFAEMFTYINEKSITIKNN
jgi:hypothetical protein